MQVELAYGRHGLTINVPDEADLLLPQPVEGIENEGAALRRALRSPIGRPPLREMVSPTDSVAIVFSDITRPMPNDRVLPVLLDELSFIPQEQIILINGLGTHRPNTNQELEQMLGSEIASQYRILQHDAWDKANLVELGQSVYGNPVSINRLYLEADIKILTGFIEPHIFAGFSGAPKAVLPAIAALETIMANHGYEMLNRPQANWGVTVGNPLWEEMREVALMTEPDLLLNVTLNRSRQITGVFAGELVAAHKQGTKAAKAAAMVPVDQPYDIVITTNSGYPLDINLYQSVKGMSCAAQIVKPGGSIIIASECSNGIPDYGEYGPIVREAGSVQAIYEIIGQPGYQRHDQWEAQLQADVQSQAEVFIYADGLSDEQIEGMLLTPCHNIEETLAACMEKHGPNASVCILPEGPQTIPYLRG